MHIAGRMGQMQNMAYLVQILTSGNFYTQSRAEEFKNRVVVEGGDTCVGRSVLGVTLAIWKKGDECTYSQTEVLTYRRGVGEMTGQCDGSSKGQVEESRLTFWRSLCTSQHDGSSTGQVEES
jgi:hypothetical protein